MWNIADTCQACRGCCKFKKKDAYFAPLFSREEKEKIEKTTGKKAIFSPYKNSTQVFQIKLVSSLTDKQYDVCPYLDEATHLCGIYELRPADCRIWPMLIMKDRDGKNTRQACFNKEYCPITEKMSAEEIKQYILKLKQYFTENHYDELYRRYPGLVWNYEPDTFFIDED
jgi:Fe-S-cluster containining protein